MSYQSRVKKRKYKRAVEKTKRTRSEETAQRWFLTFSTKDGRCACCRQQLPRKSEVVYRHNPREIRCVRCAEEREDSRGFRPSIRWQRARHKQRRRRLAT